MMISRVVVSMLRPKVCCASRIVLAVWGGRHRAVVPNRLRAAAEHRCVLRQKP
jgi:hypothetical protein